MGQLQSRPDRLRQVEHTRSRFACPRWPRGAAALVLLTLGVGPACVERPDDTPTPEDIEVIKKNLLGAAPSPRFKVNASLGEGDKVVYLGLDVAPDPLQPGWTTRLTHYWQVKEPPERDWQIFTHVQGPGGVGMVNHDHVPVQGKYPVSRWKAGDIVRDQHTFMLPAQWSSSSLDVYVGLWRANARMPVKSGPHDQQNRVLAATIPVKLPAPTPQKGPLFQAKRYLVYKTPKPIKIDGALEPAWNRAVWTQPFVDLGGTTGGVKTSAKFLWDDKNLYIAVDNADADVWGDLKGRDADLASQEAVQVLLDADGNGKSYIELQVSPNNLLFDAYLPEYRKYENALDPRRKPYDWTSKVKHAVKVDGTLNKRDDRDTSWTVELALPLADANGLATERARVPPTLGDTWRVNLVRFDAPTGKEQVAVAWAPPMKRDVHALDRFGQLVFVDANGFAPLTAALQADSKMEAAMRAAHEGFFGHGGAVKPAAPAAGGPAAAPPKPPATR
jgi:hypothetical protein